MNIHNRKIVTSCHCETLLNINPPKILDCNGHFQTICADKKTRKVNLTFTTCSHNSMATKKLDQSSISFPRDRTDFDKLCCRMNGLNVSVLCRWQADT